MTARKFLEKWISHTPADALHGPQELANDVVALLDAERQRVILAVEEYGRTDMTLSRLGELLDQSPPALRILFGRATDRLTSGVRSEGKP